MRVGILTSNDIRHRFVANTLLREFDVTLIGYQDTGYVPANTAADEIDASTAALLKHHFDERRLQEQAYLGHDCEMQTAGAGCDVIMLNAKTLNSESTLRSLQRQEVDTIVVYGTTLIKPPLLDAYAGRMINLHLGLSPYYRGTATNFYPLLNEEPEYVGATIHLIDAGIDSGDILHHARPAIIADDMPHTVGCKAILAGVEKVAQSLREMAAGTVVATPQWSPPNARAYFRRDYHPSQVVELYRLIEGGLFPKYVARKHLIENAMRLIR